jgi:hypothetical protein
VDISGESVWKLITWISSNGIIPLWGSCGSNGSADISNVAVCFGSSVRRLANTALFFSISHWFILPVISTQTCDNEVFQARCPHPHNVYITRARFGHIEVSRCVAEAVEKFGYLGCYSNVTDIIQQRCGGKNRCDIEGDDAGILATKQCEVGFPMYMDIAYTCLPGECLCLWSIAHLDIFQIPC